MIYDSWMYPPCEGGGHGVPRGMFHRMCHIALSFRTFFCHSEHSFVIQSEAKNLEYIKWVSPRSFVATLLWMTVGRGRSSG